MTHGSFPVRGLPVALAAALAFLVGAAQPGSAQAPGTDLGSECDLERFRVVNSTVIGEDTRITYVGGPDLRCPDGTRIQSDSAVIYSATGVSRLMGNVRYDSPERALRSHNADYYEQERRLFAEGEVDFTDKVRGTRLFGERLTYLVAHEDRPEERVSVSGGRPRALLPPEGREGEPPPEDAEPYEVEADRLLFEGERHFWADGDVRMRRDSVDAFADSLAYDQEVGELVLTREARLRTPEEDLTGDRIVLLLTGDEVRDVRSTGSARLVAAEYELLGDTILLHDAEVDGSREVQALVDARILGEDFDLTSQRIRAFLVEGRLERLVAGRTLELAERPEEEDPGADPEEEPRPDPDAPPDPEADAEDPAGVAPGDPDEVVLADPEDGEERPPDQELPERSRAVTPEFELLADSIDIRAPDEVLETVTGVGRGRGETRGREVPEWPHLEGMPASDWIEGDTVVARFVLVDAGGEEVAFTADAGDDPLLPDRDRGSERRYQLDGVEARGSARSLYRLPPEETPGEEVPEEEEPEEEEPEEEEPEEDPEAEEPPEEDPEEAEPEPEDPPEEEGPPLWSISYVLGDRIRIIMVDGEVDRMEVEGKVDGAHFEPRREGSGGGG